jgi:very-long-chain ceramide synthase
MAIWIYTRHWLNWRVLYATLTEFRTVGPFELNWETQQYKCWISQYITFALLACLQAVNLFWLYLILRIAKNYVFSKEELADERSEDEEEEEDVGQVKVKKEAEKKAIEGRANGSQPTVLLNGEPVHEEEKKTEGMRTRRKKA